MVRVLVVFVGMFVAAGGILLSLWSRGFRMRVAVKLAGVGAGFVVSIKMVLGSYLALQAEEPATVDVLGFYASLVLVLFFGVTIFSLWRRGTSKPSSAT